MKAALLHVISAVISTRQDAESALRALRHASGTDHSDDRILLLLCDLAPAHAERLPEDMPLLRTLQSGVMAMNARCPGRFHLLVRRREWNVLKHAYAAPVQRESIHRLMLDLISSGSTQARFEAATISPSSLRGCCSAVLFSPVFLSCTPDTPLRMLSALEHTQSGCVCARIVHRRAFPESVLDRLMRSGFSLHPLLDAQQAMQLRQGLGDPFTAAMFTLDGLRRCLDEQMQSVPFLPDCFFVRSRPATLASFFARFREDCLRESAVQAAVPLLQLLLFFAAAVSGHAALAGAALLPELGALRLVRRLPAALMRLALLPLCAFLALDTLLQRWQIKSKHIRVFVPPVFFTARAASVCGGLLLLCALSGATALAALLPVCLFWLFSPLLLPALEEPTIERIPLSNEQLAQLHSEAESAFFDCIAHCAPDNAPALHMLAACAAGMLGLLEPDETGRRVQKLLEIAPKPSCASDTAAMLAAAQYIREHMKSCDAALRELPTQLEAFACSHPSAAETSTLSVFLSCAQRNAAAPQALAALQSASFARLTDLLFLPHGPAQRRPVSSASLALTHPHTYLRRSASGLLSADSDALMRFLFLAAASLSHPFHALLMRSPVCAPYAPLWAI